MTTPDGYSGPRPAAGYLRRSTDRQEQSIPDQKVAIELYATAHGYAVVRWYVDDAISGATSGERDAFLQLVNDALSPGCPFRAVLVYDVKRFGRLEQDEVGHYRYQLRRAGVEIVYVAEGFHGDETDELLRPLKQWQARKELRDLSRDTIRGLVSRSSAGWWSGGLPPYGYDLQYLSGEGQFLMTVRYDEDLSKLLLDEHGNVTRVVPRGESLTIAKRDRCRLVPGAPERVRAVRQIYDWYVVDGLGYTTIADQLNRQGIPSARGGKWPGKHRSGWTATTIRDILQNPAYAGDFVWNRHTFAKFYSIEHGRAVPRNAPPGAGPAHNRPEDFITTKNAHAALIPRPLFQAAQDKRAERRQNPSEYSYRGGNGARSPYLLTGLIYCLRCGHKWQGRTTHRGRRRADGSTVKTFGYVCGGYVSQGTSCCQYSRLPQAKTETWVFGEIERIVADHLQQGGKEHLRGLIEEELRGEERFDGSELATVRQRRADIEGRIENMIDNITPTNRDYVDRRIVKLRDEIAELEQQEKALLERQGQERQAAELARVALALAPQVRRVATYGTVEEKSVFLRAFVHGIGLDPASRQGIASFYATPVAGSPGTWD